MLPDDELEVLLNAGGLPASPCRRTMYRCVEQGKLYGLNRPVPFPDPIPLYSRSSSDRGARFTARGGPDTLYMAEDITVAYLEVDRAYKKVEGLQPKVVPPMAPPVILFAIKVELERVLDLTDAGIQAALKTNVAELTATWRLKQHRKIPVPTQTLGTLIFQSGRFQALRFPSARDPRGCCLALFPDLAIAPSLVEVFDPYGELVGRIP